MILYYWSIDWLDVYCTLSEAYLGAWVFSVVQKLYFDCFLQASMEVGVLCEVFHAFFLAWSKVLLQLFGTHENQRIAGCLKSVLVEEKVLLIIWFLLDQRFPLVFLLQFRKRLICKVSQLFLIRKDLLSLLWALDLVDRQRLSLETCHIDF